MNPVKQHTPGAESLNGNKKPFFQPKLTVNQPNDVYEQEADAMANKVMRMTIGNEPATAGFFKPAVANISRKCQHCDEEEQVHRKESTATDVRGSHDLDSYVGSLSSSGQALSASNRQFFEPRFGHDFSDVKIHTDSVAAKSAQSINALAYTSGNIIVFNSGQFSPESESGKKLLAHELTHVVQQKSADENKVQRMMPCPATLQDADPVPVGWRLYPGPTSVFHCGFRTILENREPTWSDLMNECVYDHSGVLVTDSHPYAGCKGTPDRFNSSSGFFSALAHASPFDPGGISREGFPAFATSRVYDMSTAIARGIEVVSTVGNTLNGIANAIGNTFVLSILTARAICDPVNWTYNGVPDRSRRHLNVMGGIISSIGLSGNINTLLANLTKPLNNFPIPALLAEIAADINPVLSARGVAPISAAAIGSLSLYQFVEWLKEQGLIAYNRPPDQAAAADLQQLLHPQPIEP